LLAAELAQAAARDQQKLDLLRMTKHFDFLQSFRPESVVKKFFADARQRTAGTQPCHVPKLWPELMAGLDSAPCIAIRRLLDSDVVVTLPGFTKQVSEACLAGCRTMKQRRCAPILLLLLCFVFL
jgi:hypothetical protein